MREESAIGAGNYFHGHKLATAVATGIHCGYDCMLTLHDVVRPTTLIKSDKLCDHLGLDLTIASETFQRTGSFKFRAAYNLALNIPNDEILTASSGNFGQALAYACKLLGKKCTVVMPETSAKVKIDAVRGFGATVDLIDTRVTGRSQRVAELSAEMPSAYYASAYDDRLVIEGNSTLGEELAPESFDVVIAPVGGGGLISGIITGLGRNGSHTEVYGAEPFLGNDAARSLREGHLVRNEFEPLTIADGARTISLGELNWPIIRDGVREIFEIADESIADAMRLYFEFANLKCEPTGALSLAGAVQNSKKFKDRRVCVVVSGGNVDASVYLEILSSGERRSVTAPSSTSA